MSSFKYEFQGFSQMDYKFTGAWRVWKYKCKRKEWKDVVIRAVGSPLVLSFKTSSDEARGKSLVIFFYAFTGGWFRAIQFAHKEALTNGHVVKRLRDTMVRCGLMSRFQKILFSDGRHMRSRFDWDSFPLEADDLRR